MKRITLTAIDSSTWIAYSILFVLVALVFYVSNYEPNINLPEVVTEDRPDFSFEDVIVSQIDNGELIWEIHSNYAEINKSDKKVRLRKVQGKIFDNDKRIVTFNSPTAELGTDDSGMVLNNPKAIVYLPTQQLNIRTKNLVFNSTSRVFEGVGGVEVTTTYMRITGKRLMVDTQTKKIRIIEDAFAEIYEAEHAL